MGISKNRHSFKQWPFCSRLIGDLESNLIIKYFIILEVLRQSMERFGGAYLRVITPAGKTDPFEEKSQRWRAVGNIVSDLTGPRFEPPTYRSRDKRVTARPTGRF